MPGGETFDPDEGELRPSLWQRLVHGRDNAPLGDRLRDAVLKPVEPGAAKKAPDEPRSVEELEAAVKFADDKERLVGLLAAPFAAIIGLSIVAAMVSHDATRLKTGQVSSTYGDLRAVLLVMSVLMLGLAWYRKRLFLGIVMALYGLAVFNLRWWGFGIPFVLAGAWLLVRAYRAQRDLREATGGPSRRGGTAPGTARPKPNKRYTPPT